MDFAHQIKKIREEQHLTQEQFAIRLNVTRQAVSNWENNKNLPDIGMLILISDVFGISLDQLIKGGDGSMNNMTEKVIRDGSEMRQARFNMTASVIGLAALVLGILCFVIKAYMPEYIDAEGILHEAFFLIPIGYLCFACGLISFITLGVHSIACWVKERKANRDAQ
ncbi:MAG: DUF3955 domain-containing protein [Lachnospiraceae bacterium]|jgi:transcriptional regulator with XRE-family HTH domain